MNRLSHRGAFLMIVLLGVALVVHGAKGFSAEPARNWVIYLLPHSHIDIGYTHLQPEVEQKQIENIDRALELCRKTADYPPEARFKWNVEVLWPVDVYMRRATPEKQQALLDAVKKGQIGLDALFGNELTGLCRPEELTRLCDFAQQLGDRCGTKVDSAMISDVPGLTWGTVTSLAEAGVKYMSLGHNMNDSGRALPTWEDKPFYWVGPDSRNKLLCWAPYKGYALGFAGFVLDRDLPGRLAELEKKGYPYDIVQLHWAVGSDNGPPDETLSDVVKKWNAEHASSKLIIATSSEMFHAFEQRYGDKLPVVQGDYTPYWENGACSSARETASNRTAAERLVQAEMLAAMLAPQKYPASQFAEAWRNVILYDEHTWGAFNSISEPDLQFVKDQWKIKQAFAIEGERQSRDLLASALASRNGEPAAGAVDVFNTSNWPRTDLVVLGKEQSAAGDVVRDPAGKDVPSQRLSTGELAFLAQDVPGLAGRRYTIGAGKAAAKGNAKVEGHTIGNGFVSVQVDPESGAIVSLKRAGLDAELCDAASGVGLNRYYYVADFRVAEAQQTNGVKIRVKEAGPLVASLAIDSTAPGCASLCREIRMVDGIDRVELTNTLDKTAVRPKEGVHFGFAFHVPDGTMRIDIPWAVMRPEADQIPGSCKNWFSAGRWVDVSNQNYGVTCATLDAPMVEVGAITGEVRHPCPKPEDWMAAVTPSQTFYSMVMNNHWHTNYKADQDGPTTFRYAFGPHGAYDAGAAQRFGIECSQPLLVAEARGIAPDGKSWLTVEPNSVVVSSLRPVDGGKQIAARLFNASGETVTATIRPANGSATPLEMAPWAVTVVPVAATR